MRRKRHKWVKNLDSAAAAERRCVRRAAWVGVEGWKEGGRVLTSPAASFEPSGENARALTRPPLAFSRPASWSVLPSQS